MVLSLILPCYNPQQGWERNIVNRYNEFCSGIGEQAELIIVLDGISPGVATEHISWIQQQIPTLKLVANSENMGKGFAIRQGVAKAEGELIMYTDVDMPYTNDSMYAVYRVLSTNNCDVAVGVKDAGYYSHLPLVRRIISRCLQFMIRIFLSMPVTDTQCGLKGFNKKVKPLFLGTTINRYLFDLEFIRNCYKEKKYKVLPIAVTLNEQVHFRKMNYKILFLEMLNFVRLLFKRP